MTNSLQPAIWSGNNVIRLFPKILYRILGVLFIAALFSPIIACAEEPGLNLSGSIRGGYWSSSRTLDERQDLAVAAIWLKSAPRLWPDASIFMEGWVINQNTLRGEETQGELREGYLELNLARLDIRAGKQVIQWGRADGVNPTDNLTPWNYTLLFPEDNELRSGIPSFKANYYYGSITFTGIWIPLFEPNKFPLPEEFHVTNEKPSNNNEYALKIDSTAELFDWSLSYFEGFDLMPDIGLNGGITLRYPRIKVFGGDFAATLDKFGIRGEAAYFFTEDENGNDPLKKNPYLFYVLGVDRNLTENLYLNLQFIQRIVTDYKNPFDIQDPVLRDVAVKGAIINNQLDRVTNMASFKLGYKLFYETLKTEFSAVYNFTRKAYLIKPRLIYTFTDHWTGTLGADIYHGKEDSLFGMLEKNTAVFAEFKYGF